MVIREQRKVHSKIINNSKPKHQDSISNNQNFTSYHIKKPQVWRQKTQPDNTGIQNDAKDTQDASNIHNNINVINKSHSGKTCK